MAVISVATTARAARCGDDVGGRRIACSCGDAVVSDTRLLPEDPVVSQRCDGDGLIVFAPSDTRSIRLDLGGQSIVGQGRGVGVRVLRGGSDGAIIVGGDDGSKATIANFTTGVRAGGLRSVQELRDVQVTGNTRDGVRMRSSDGLVSGVGAARNGRDGVKIGGHNPRLEDVEANENGRFGVRVGARRAVVDASASGNRRGDLSGHDDVTSGR